MPARVLSSLTAASPTANGRAYEQKGSDNQYSDHFSGFLCGDGEGAQFASLALTALAGASLPRASSPWLGLTDVDLVLATPHTLPRRCVGLSLDEAWIASPSRLEPNSDFQKWRLKPFSRRSVARALRDAADAPPRTTATILRPSRVALATTLNPDSQMKPVFMPSAPGKLTSRLLWVRIVFLPTFTWIEEKTSACSGNSTMMARASLAKSRAVDTCRSSGRPLTLVKLVRVMPRRCASWFIRATNACSLRATVSAIITATSLADFTMSTFSATSRVIAPPTGRPSLVGACALAFCEQTTLVSRATVPAFSAWKVT